MSSFLNKVFGRKKDGESSPGWRSASGDLLDGKFEDVSPTVSPAAAQFPDLQENGSPRGRGNDRAISESKLRTFFRSKSRSRATSPIRQQRKLEELPHLPLSLLANLNQDEVEVLLSDKVIGERRLTPVEAVGLVKVCSRAINNRGVDSLGLMNPNWYSASPEVQRRLISLFIQSLTARSPMSTLPSFDSEINSTRSPHDIAAVLRWALRHLQLQGDAFGHQEEWYHAFFDAEQKAEYPPKAFSTTLSPLIPSEHLNLLKEVLDLCSSLSPHGEANSTSGSKLSKIFGLWLLNAHRVETNDDWKSFYDRWEIAGRQLEHIFFARIRDEAVEKRIPTRLVDLVRKYPFYRDNASPTTDLRLLPRSKLSTLIYDALLVRVETEVPTDKLRPKSRIHPVRVIADALSSQIEEGELSSLWAKISEVSKGEGSGTPLSRIFSDDTIRLLSLLPDDDGSTDDKSPTYSLLPLSPASPKFKRNSFSLSEFTEEMKRTHSTQSTASPLTPIGSAISADWSLFSSTGFGASPTLTPLSSALFSPDIERTSPPSRKASRHGKEVSSASTIPRKSVEFAPNVAAGINTKEQPANYPSKIAALQIVQVDEAFVDFYSDALLDPVSSNWPSFVVCKLKPSVVPDLKYGPADVDGAQKTLQWLVLEQRYTVTPPPAPVPEEVVEAPHERPSSPQSISKRRFSFWTASRSNSATSIGSTKSKKKDLLRSQRASEMGEVVEEGDSTGAGTVRQSSSTRSRRRTKLEDVVKVRIPSPKPRKSGDVRSLKSIDVGPAPVVKKPVPSLDEKEKKDGAVVPLAAAAGVAAVLAAGVEPEKEKEEVAPEPAEGKGVEVEGTQPVEEVKEETVPVEVGEEKPEVVEEVAVPAPVATEDKAEMEPTVDGETTVVTHIAEPTAEEPVADVKEEVKEAVKLEEGATATEVEPPLDPEPVLERALVERVPAPVVEDDAVTSTIPEVSEEVTVDAQADPVPPVAEPSIEAAEATPQAPQPTQDSAPLSLPAEEPAPAIPELNTAVQEPEPTIVESLAEVAAVPSVQVEVEADTVEKDLEAEHQEDIPEAPATIEAKDEVPTANGHLAEDVSPGVLPVEDGVPESPVVAIEAARPTETGTPAVDEEVDAPALEPEVLPPQEEGVAIVPKATVTDASEEAAPIDTIVENGSLKEDLAEPVKEEDTATIPFDMPVLDHSTHELPTDPSKTDGLSVDETKPEATDTIVKLHSNAELGTAALENDAQETTANPVDREAEREAEEREPIHNRTLTTQEGHPEPSALVPAEDVEAPEATVDEDAQVVSLAEDASQDGAVDTVNLSGVPHLEPLKTGDDDESNEEVDLPAVPLVDTEIRQPLDTSEHLTTLPQHEEHRRSIHLSETLEAQHLPPAIEHALEIGSTPSAEALLDAVQSNESPTEGDSITRSTPPAINVALAASLAGADDLPTAIEAAFESGLAPNPEALLNAVQATLTATVFAPGEPSPSVEKKEEDGGLNRAPGSPQLNGNGLHTEPLEPETKEDGLAHDDLAATGDTEAPEQVATAASIYDIPGDPAPASAKTETSQAEETELVPEIADASPAEETSALDVEGPEPTVHAIPEATFAPVEPEETSPSAGASDAEGVTTPLGDKEPSVVEHAEAAPLIEEDIPAPVEGTPVVEEEVSEIEQGAPLVEEEATPSLEETLLVVEEARQEEIVAVETKVLDDERSLAIEIETPVVEEPTPVESEIPAVVEEVFAVTPEEQTPVVDHDALNAPVSELEAAAPEVPAPAEGEETAAEDIPVIEEDTPAIEAQEPVLEVEVLTEEVAEAKSVAESEVVEEEIPIEQESPVVAEESPVVEGVSPAEEEPAPGEAAIVTEDAPLVLEEEKDAPMVEEQVPVAEEAVVEQVREQSVEETERPLVEDEPPTEEVPVVEEAPTADDLPPAKEEVPIIEESPAGEDTIKVVDEEDAAEEPKSAPVEEPHVEKGPAVLNGETPTVEENEEPVAEDAVHVAEEDLEEEKPAVREEEPVVKDDAPTPEEVPVEETPEQEEEPEGEGEAPAVEEKAVVEESPVEEELAPLAEEGARAIDEEDVPVIEQAPPVDEAPVEEARPNVDEETPVVEEERVVEEKVNVEEETPAIEDQTPLVDEQTLVEEEEQPEIPAVPEEDAAAEEKPVVEEVPVVEEEVPVAEQVTAVVDEETPVVEEEAPVDDQATPALEQETPAVGGKAAADDGKDDVEAALTVDEVNPVPEGPAAVEEAENVVVEEAVTEEKGVAEEEKPIVEDDVAPAEEGEPVVDQEVPEVDEKIVEEEQPTLQDEETPVVEGQPSVVKNDRVVPVGEDNAVGEAPPTVDEGTIAEDNPVAEKDVPPVEAEEQRVEEADRAGEDEVALEEKVAEEEAPVEGQAPEPKKEEENVDLEEEPVVEEGTPAVRKPTPEEVDPVVEETAPVIEPDVAENEEPVVEQEAPIIDEETPVTPALLVDGGKPAADEEAPNADAGSAEDSPLVDEEELPAAEAPITVEAPVIEEVVEVEDAKPTVENEVPVEEVKPADEADIKPPVVDEESAVEGEAPDVDGSLVVEEPPVAEEALILENGQPAADEVPALKEELSIEEDTPVVEQETPVADEDTSIVEDSTLAIVKQPPSLVVEEDEVPAVKEEVSAAEEIPAVEEDPIVEQIPVVEESIVEEIPAVDATTAVEETLSTDSGGAEATPALEPEVPIVEDAYPVADEENPAPVEDKEPVIEVAPVAEPEAVVVEDGSPVVEETPTPDPKPIVEDDAHAAEPEPVVEDDAPVAEETPVADPPPVAYEDDAPILEASAAHEESPETNDLAQVPVTLEEKERSPLIETEDLPAAVEDVPLATAADPVGLPTEDEAQVPETPTLPPRDAPQAESATLRAIVNEDVPTPVPQAEAQPEPTTESEEPTAVEETTPTIIDKLSTPLVEEDDDPIEVNELKPSTTVAGEAMTTPNA